MGLKTATIWKIGVFCLLKCRILTCDKIMMILLLSTCVRLFGFPIFANKLVFIKCQFCKMKKIKYTKEENKEKKLKLTNTTINIYVSYYDKNVIKNQLKNNYITTRILFISLF